MFLRLTEKPLDAEKLAGYLHNTGLWAYHNYEAMGRGREKWDDFRLQIARELLQRLVIFEKK